MSSQYTALKLGLQLVQIKLGQALGDPSFSVFDNAEQPQSQEMAMGGREAPTELPKSNAQIKDRSAKIEPPRVVTTR